MATTYKSPGVYVEEISKLPASVAQVETAIPAFIGYTEKSPATAGSVVINSIRDYEDLFGGPEPESYEIDVKDSMESGELASRLVDIQPTSTSNGSKFKLYYSLQLFFQNGGGKCYIISVGGYGAMSKTDFLDGLDVLEKEDEPTLILFPDANSLPADSYYEIAEKALSQASGLGDRFVILDVHNDAIKDFRNKTGVNNLKYGAAYYPHLATNTPFLYRESEVSINHTIDDSNGSLPASLDLLKDADSALYNDLKARLETFKVELPPSGLIAGVYARTDEQRGVWTSPANTSLSGLVGPVSKISNAEQDTLNIDSESGKSINAIRTFAGKGTLVWGARTLAGNDNEWRYISVRRFFNMVEESLRKSTSWAVFEPNDANTWVKVKGMIQNYLIGLWRQGALQGGTPEQAFFVKIGLGQTMTSLDVLEGRMNVEIGLATVRPAEFIILKFSHKLPE